MPISHPFLITFTSTKNFHRNPSDATPLEEWKKIAIYHLILAHVFMFVKTSLKLVVTNYPHSKHLLSGSIPKPSSSNSGFLSKRTSVDTVIDDHHGNKCFSNWKSWSNYVRWSESKHWFYFQSTLISHPYFSKIQILLKVIQNINKLPFLSDRKVGILGKACISIKKGSPSESKMYRIHRNVLSHLSRLKCVLRNERAHLHNLRDLCNKIIYDFIDQHLNFVTKNFINSVT